MVVDTEGPLRVAGLPPAYCRALLLVDGVNIATCKNLLELTRRGLAKVTGYSLTDQSDKVTQVFID